MFLEAFGGCQKRPTTLTHLPGVPLQIANLMHLISRVERLIIHFEGYPFRSAYHSDCSRHCCHCLSVPSQGITFESVLPEAESENQAHAFR